MSVAIANQWALTFNQPASFGLTPPALQSTVIALTPANSVGGGSGTPTAGNWLFCISGWNQNQVTASTHAVADDIHSFWRPGDVTTSTYAVSTSAGHSRVNVWYTPNLARVPGDVYIAPSNAVDGRACLVIEVSGLGPWDTVAGINTNYAAAATSLSLALGAPSAQALIIGAVCGDLTGAGQAFLPTSWTGLSTVTAQNGTDHVADAVLTSAYIVTSGSVSVSASATGATDLAGVLISVLTSAPSPSPANQNVAWPYMKFEAAFGSGYETPPDQMTWTDLTNRHWAWYERTGIQYQLGNIQATDLVLELDNNDNMLSEDNPASYFYTASGVNWSPQAAFYDNEVLANAPLGWWKLNDASGSSTAADSSGNSHSGTATSVTFGNASQAVSGNNSASFNGTTSNILTSYNPALSKVSVECWINQNGLSQGAFPRFFANSNTATDAKGFQMLLISGTPSVTFGNGTTFTTVSTTSNAPATGWTHLVATWDGTTILMYFNGVQQGTGTLSGSMAAGAATGIGIGYDPAGSFGFFNGLIAECAIYGTVLTATQIAAHYTAGPTATGTPIRFRAAVGTMGGVTSNRWYVIQRNAHEWPQMITDAYRRFAPVTATDIWAATSSYGPSPYRGEVLQDLPYAWWPCDDQPLQGGVLPTVLRNAAPGNSNSLNITLSPNGATAQLVYATVGTAPVTNNTGAPPPLIAQYVVGQPAGWMYGDPQSSPLDTISSGGVVTAQPGSAAWTQVGVAGNTGSNAYFLIVNDANFPVLANGVTIEGWFNCPFFGTSTGQSTSIYANGSGGDQTGQPYSNITIVELATASAAVCVLQLDRDTGNLNLITYVGNTPTTHAIYTTADLRGGAWHHFAISLTNTTWAVYLDGGQLATVSGSGVNMTSAWTYLIACGDTGTAGGTGTASIAHSGNMSLAHLAVYPAQLPAYRIIAHYWSAITGFGVLPAPQGVSATMTANASGGQANTWAGDGSIFQGTYTGTLAAATSEISAVVTANAGSFTSGPSAWAPTAAIGERIFAWITWTTGLAPAYQIYTASSHGSETEASTTVGYGDAFSAGYGGSATGAGRCHSAGGTGASPPTSPTATGDTVGQRLERIISYGAVGVGASPQRCIDASPLAVQAATDLGGQQVGQNLQNIADSDSGLLFVDNLGNLTYWQKTHLAAQSSSPAWTITPDAPPVPGASSTAIPYHREINWVSDPQRVWNSITITPFSPDGANLPLVIPSNTAAVILSQQKYGAQPLQITSYLQSTTEMASQANWLLANYGQLQIRVEDMLTDAAPYPAAWPYVLGVNVGDVITVQNWTVDNTGVTNTFRVSGITRDIRFAGRDGAVRASVKIQADFEPPSYWS